MSEPLRQLCDAIATAVGNAIHDGSLRRITKQWLVKRTELYEASRAQYFEHEDREAWDGDALHRLAATMRLQESDHFEAATEDLAQRYNHDPASVRGHLEGLLVTVGREVADAKGRHEVDELVQRFVDELAGGSLRWQGTIWLRNLQLIPEQLRIDSAFSLRQPQGSDFESAVPIHYSYVPQIENPFDEPDCVLEVDVESTSQPDHLVRRFVNCLCLFRVGNVSILRTAYSCNSLISGKGGIAHRFQQAQTRFQCSLTAADRESLAVFCNQVATLLPVNPTGHHEDRSWYGLKFYFRALLDATDDEERLAQAVASIESILCAGTREDLRRAVSQRTAALLQFSGLEAPAVEQDVSRAYKIRSAFAHGDQAKEKDLRDLSALCDRVMDYARLVAIKDLELRLIRQTLSRKKLAKLLDASLLDRRCREALKQEVRGGLWEAAVPHRA